MRARWISLIILLITLSTISILYLGLTQSPTSQPPSETSSVSRMSSQEAREDVAGFLDVGEIYEELGYPRMSWNPQSPNYTVSYRYLGDRPIHYRLGYLKMPAIDLEEALEIASKAANITPQNYKLVSAYFSPGHVVNGSLLIEPTWSLHFVRTFKGYWICLLYTSPSPRDRG